MILPDLPKSPADTNAVPLGVRVSGEYVPLSYERVRERRDDDQRFEGGTIFELTPVRPLPAGVEITILTVSAPFSMHRRCGDCPTGFTTTEGVLARFRTRADSGRDRLVWDGEIRFDTQERAPDRWRNHPFHELLASFGAFAPHMVLIWEGEFTPPMGQPNRWAFISGDVPRVSLQTGSAPDAVSLYLQAVDYTGRRGQTVWVQGTIQHPVARAWATAAWLVAASVFGLAVLLGFRARRKHASR